MIIYPLAFLFRWSIFITSNLILRANFAYDTIYNDSKTDDNFQCYHTTTSPKNTDWESAYQEDKSTSTILSILSTNRTYIWTPSMLKLIPSEYHPHLKSHHINIQHGKLILYKAIFKHVKYIGLIIAPLKLRRLIFSHFHAGPSIPYQDEVLVACHSQWY